jgi:hypothetical protein
MYLGQVLIGVTGGLSIGIRIMLFKEGLLISDMAFYAANWAVIAVLGAIGGATVVVKGWQRWGVVSGLLRFLYIKDERGLMNVRVV